MDGRVRSRDDLSVKGPNIGAGSPWALIDFFARAFALTWVVWVTRAMGVNFGVIGQLKT